MFDRNEPKNIELTAELSQLERQLTGLEIAPLRVERDRLMFEAGRAAERAERELAATLRVAGAPLWFWPSAAAMMTAACVVLGAMLVWRGDTALVAQQQAKPPLGRELGAERQAVSEPKIEAPAGEDVHEMQRFSSRSDGSTWLVRPAGGYLEKRYIALTRGVGELRSEGGGGVSLQPEDSTQPVTARELLRELVPSRVSLAPNS